MVQAMINISERSNRMLNIVKAKFGLRDKSQAINKLTELFGQEIEHIDAREEYVKEIIQLCDEHSKKYPARKMTLSELDELCEAN